MTATFIDGTAETGHLLIGADGAHSATRKWLFRSSPEKGAMLETPIVASVAITTLRPDIAVAVRNLNPRAYLTMDSDGLVTWASGT